MFVHLKKENQILDQISKYIRFGLDIHAHSELVFIYLKFTRSLCSYIELNASRF